MFVKLEIPGSAVIRMSDYKSSLIINGETYDGVGYFMGITDTSSELRLNNSELTITLNGVPNKTLAEFMSLPVKGSAITVIRGLYTPANEALLSIAGNPTGKFKGIVNNYSITDNQDGANASSTISLICKSEVGMVAGRNAGRRTNPADQKLFFPTDKSMDRVPSLANSKINFGSQV
jgi:hypothetical protein